jgi:hypothetical protein
LPEAPCDFGSHASFRHASTGSRPSTLQVDQTYEIGRALGEMLIAIRFAVPDQQSPRIPDRHRSDGLRRRSIY